MKPAWMDDALCREVDPELFFPKKGDYPVASAARVICQGCDVREQCLAYALENPAFGIWGGLTAQERQRRYGVSTEPRRVPLESVCGSEGGYVRHLRRDETPCEPCRNFMRHLNAERIRRRTA